MVGGYTPAFPDFEDPEPGSSQLFGQWINRDEPWLRGAGSEMDFISLHLYDFESIFSGSRLTKGLRRGSNVDATFDLLDNAMDSAFGGQLKPYVISEYGNRVHTMEG